MFLKENYCNHILQLMSFRWHKVLSFFQYFDSSTIHQINLKTQLYSHDIEQEYVNHPKRNFSKTFFKVIDLNPSPTPATLRFIEAGKHFHERTFLKGVLNWTFKEGDLRCTVDRKHFICFYPTREKSFIRFQIYTD